MTGPRDSEGHSLGPDTLYDLFANEHRRQILSYLETKDTDVAELNELAEHVHEEVDGVTSPDYARLILTHMHVPKLAEEDVIEYDQRSETVRYRDGRHVEAMLAVVTAYD